MHPFGAGVFDLVLSNFGVMFFEDPAAAFGNLRKALLRGGRLAFVCWRTRAENPVFTTGFADAAAVLGVREVPGPGAAVSLADTGPGRRFCCAARGSAASSSAKTDEPMLIGRGVDDVLDTERASPTAADIVAGLSPAQAAELTRQVRDRRAAYASPDGVVMPGAAWLVNCASCMNRALSLNRTHRFGSRAGHTVDLGDHPGPVQLGWGRVAGRAGRSSSPAPGSSRMAGRGGRGGAAGPGE